MPADPPRILSERSIYRGKKFDFVSLTVERPGGGKLEREIVRHPGAVVVVPILEREPKRHGAGTTHVVLIRNFRIAIGEPLIECCAGTIERARPAEGGFGPPEDPAACASRELIEETGYQAATVKALGWFYTTPGLTDEQMHVFAATGLTHVGQRLEEDESIEVLVVPAGEAMVMVREGAIRDGKSIVALTMAERAGFLKA